MRILGYAIGVSLIGLAIYIFSLPAGNATVGEIRGIAGFCGLLIGSGIGLVGLLTARN